jgi:hypothetical protein
VVEPEYKWDRGKNNQSQPNEYLKSVICSALCATVNGDDESMDDDDETKGGSRTELDTHANMPVVGHDTLIIADSGSTVEVNPFTPDYPAMKARIVDAAVRYDCPFSGIPYLLILRNAIYVPAMVNNLIPPFIMREAGIKVNDVPKIHVEDPSANDHAIIFSETGFRIPLKLWGVFLYFPTSKPSTEDHDCIDEVYVLTPSNWDPHTNVFARNEESMIDWEGNMVLENHRPKIVLSEIEEDTLMAASLELGNAEQDQIDACVLEEFDLQTEAQMSKILNHTDEVAAVLSGVSPLLDPVSLCSRLVARAEIGKFKMSIGATTAHNKDYLVEDVSDDEDGSVSSDDSDDSEML